ncbi:MAG TPA: permease-like cell division protein FtsX [Desulfuromonadales bacterium]|nr:permease-like cell division protein FtsX [Desulfuromonadales bacterium]
MFERLVYFIRRSLRNMRQSPLLCTAAVGTVAVALTILAFFAIVVLNVQQLTSHWSREVQVVTYLDKTPDATQLQRLKNDISQLPTVAKVLYVSPAEALSRFKKRLGADADLLEGVGSDALPASFEITLKPNARNRQGVIALVKQLKGHPDFEDFRYGQDWLDRFDAFVTLLKVAGAVLGSFLLFAALFITSNTIKLTLYARRDELEVMTLVGGTPIFVKTPFLIEGAVQGTAGGLLALIGTYLLYLLFLRQGLGSLLLTTGAGTITFLPPTVQCLLIGTGTLLGLTGSLLSLRKLVRI